MTIKKVDHKEEIFWIVNFILSAILIAILFMLRHSENLLSSVTNEEALLTFCEYGLWFLFAYAGMFTGLYFFRGRRERIKKGFSIVCLVEVIFLIVKIFSVGLSGFSVAAFVLVANIITVLEVLAHERLLV